MPFSQTTKARIFVKSARICCLCYKQCGTNIEAAHIVPEAAGGSNEDDNAIPLCFDCHQEVGAYALSHPRGNKFSHAELRARREQLYRLVESGALQAQIIAARLQGIPSERDSIDATDTLSNPSHEASKILEEALDSLAGSEALSRKLKLISAADRAYVVDSLVSKFQENSALQSLLAILATGEAGSETLLVLERLLRQVTLTATVAVKAQFMSLVPVELLKKVDTSLREAFFLEIIEIMRRDQFEEVNKITPAVPNVQDAIPESLLGKYVVALCSQADSSAWQGAPAAKRALRGLPSDMIRAGLATVSDDQLLGWRNDALKDFVREHEDLWPTSRTRIFKDFTRLSHLEFMKRYYLDKQG